MFERLKLIEERFNNINEELMSSSVINDIKKMKTLSKEQADLKEIVDKYDIYKKILLDIDDAKDMLNDKEMEEFLLEEIKKLNEDKEKIINELEIMLLPKDINDKRNVIIEIRGAAGGDEANIFAGDLYRMYTRYANNQGWIVELIDALDGTSGGFSQIELMIKGIDVYSKLKYESGAHRVQRVPETESQGRVHTSTATVVVMPEAEDIDVDIKESDIRIDITRSSGAGGQSVNTTDSAVRMTHIPTGIVVYSQTERSQLKNREKAIKLLKTRVYEYYLRIEEEKVGTEKKTKIGKGDRSEKIRTYNYPQNRITDHRINFSVMNLDKVMDGQLEPIIEELIHEDQKLRLKG